MEIQKKMEELKEIAGEIGLPSDLWATFPNGVNREATRKAYLEIAQRLTEYEGEEDELRDYLGEIADSAVPIYTGEKWDEFTSYRLWASSELEEEAEEMGFTVEGDISEVGDKYASALLYVLYYHAGHSLISWATGAILEARVNGEMD